MKYKELAGKEENAIFGRRFGEHRCHDMELTTLRDKMLKLSEYLFIILCGFYVAEFLLGITTFDVQLPLYLTQAAFNLLVVTVCIRVICQIRSRLDAKLVFSTGNYADVTFSAGLTDADEMDILGISWQKTPVYDVHSTYGPDGLKTDDVWYDLSGNACMNRDGYAACSYEYNDNRSVTAIHYLGPDGKPVNIRYGYSDVIRIYDDQNRLIKEDHYNVSGAPASVPDGYTTTEWEYDKNGNTSAVRYFDETHTPAVLKDGYSLIKREYDDEHRMTKEIFCDANEKTVILADHSSGTKRSYDEKGRLSSIVFIGQKGEPVQNSHGASMIRRVYDNAGLTNEIYCDLMGNPVITDAGYSRRERLCDGAGRVWLYRYYTPDGSMADIAQIQCDYDENDVLTEISFKDKDGIPMTCCYGFSRAALRYDKAGKLSTVDCYDEGGAPVSIPEEIEDDVRFLIF